MVLVKENLLIFPNPLYAADFSAHQSLATEEFSQNN